MGTGVLLRQLRLRADAMSSNLASKSATASEPARPSAIREAKAAPRGQRYPGPSVTREAALGFARKPQHVIAVPS